MPWVGIVAFSGRACLPSRGAVAITTKIIQDFFDGATPTPTPTSLLLRPVWIRREREAFGAVRYTFAGGLEREARPEEYVEKVDEGIKEEA